MRRSNQQLPLSAIWFLRQSELINRRAKMDEMNKMGGYDDTPAPTSTLTTTVAADAAVTTGPWYATSAYTVD